MADLLALSYGIIPITATRAAPATLLSTATDPQGVNFETFTNQEATNWVFLKDATDPGSYVLLLPGQSATIARGPQSANNMRKVVGFATAPSSDYISDGAAATAKVTLSSKKLV